MRLTIPRRFLTQTVTVRPYAGRSAYGALYGDEFTVRCRIEPRNEVVRDRSGNETVASARLFCGPNETIPVESVIAWQGSEYDVIAVMPQPGPSGAIHHQELLLR